MREIDIVSITEGGWTGDGFYLDTVTTKGPVRIEFRSEAGAKLVEVLPELWDGVEEMLEVDES